MRKITDFLNDNQINFETRIEYGKPAKRILEVANHDDFDLIVIGTPHILSLKRMIFGDLVSKIIRNSKCPVLVIP